MTVARQNHATNIVLGAGEVYLDVYEDGKKTGERYLGDSASATITATSEEVTVLSGDGPVATELANAVRSATHRIAFAVKDSSIANWALYLLGEETGYADAATAVTDEEIVVAKRGRWYRLGVTAAKPTGVAAVAEAGFAATYSKVNADTALAATSFMVDHERARIFIAADAAEIADGDTIKIDYTPVASPKRRQARSARPKQIVAAFAYLEDPASGEGRNLYAPKCSIAPGGETALKSRETEQQLPFTASVVDPGGALPGIMIDGVEL
ncbi:MAG: hypothetical protein OXC28_07120 [Defluviicoccus sp.]|nr:hypothetical protein [Defluviicoccus sp.]